MDALRRIVRGLRLSARDAERVAGISGAQLFVLQVLSEAHAYSLNELAARTFTDQSSVSVVVQKLARRKLVVRKTSASDGRRIEIHLAPAGRALLRRCPEPTQTRLLSAVQRLEPHELTALTVGLAALVREAGMEDEKPQLLFDDVGKEPRARRAAARATTKTR